MQHGVSLKLAVTVAALTLAACASPTNPNQPPPSAQGVYFVEPANGATVSSPFKVRFGIKGMEVKPAGAQVASQGHHHLLINVDSQPKGEIIPRRRHPHPLRQGADRNRREAATRHLQVDDAVRRRLPPVVWQGHEREHQRDRQVTAT